MRQCLMGLKLEKLLESYAGYLECGYPLSGEVIRSHMGHSVF